MLDFNVFMDADRVLVAEKDAEILNLQSQMAGIARHIVTLRAERQLAQERLDSYRYPVLTLPNEITSEIFLHFVPAYPEASPLTGLLSPILLTHICCLWREVAQSTVALWQTIDFTWDGSKQPSEEEMTSIVTLWLERSQSAPISVEATYEDPSIPIPTVLFRHSARYERLSLSVEDAEELSGFNGPMPLLHALSLKFHEHSFNADIFQNVPLLRTLELEDCGTLSVRLPWSQLTSLTMGYVGTQDVASILREASNLAYLSLNLWDTENGMIHVADIALIHLEHLVFGTCESDDEFFAHLVTPALRHLELPEYFLQQSGSVVESLQAFISKSGCELEKLYITKAFLSEVEYRNAFPSISVTTRR
ncbi:F-box domain-containing protein [Favolaschia claudopus]|uniref:F-box domain-containing protein n=1 Tax=Favolaschia claudopus TaxID=2862362 RepID=A0AAW0ANV4_9AGAR